MYAEWKKQECYGKKINQQRGDNMELLLWSVGFRCFLLTALCILVTNPSQG